ncbi:hypothetical protein HDU78_000912 [Chytriomyces hyalinus]|nr:hypothetical protein HDU78_000912 [Chytriomyces hyalinus]
MNDLSHLNVYNPRLVAASFAVVIAAVAAVTSGSIAAVFRGVFYLTVGVGMGLVLVASKRTTKDPTIEHSSNQRESSNIAVRQISRSSDIAEMRAQRRALVQNSLGSISDNSQVEARSTAHNRRSLEATDAPEVHLESESPTALPTPVAENPASVNENGEDEDETRSAIDQLVPLNMEKLLADLETALENKDALGLGDDDGDAKNPDRDEDKQEFTEEHLEECKHLVALLYSISEEQARKDGYVHRGVTCNHCGAQPIRGVRYHCLNCPDYDLCEGCENLGDVHPKTHAFIKLRIPLAPHTNMRTTGAPVMYPGQSDLYSAGVWNADEEIGKVSDESHFESVEVHALFEQFLTLATVPPSSTTPGGITRPTFDQCLGALGKEKNLITDRIFAFFDQDSDNLISFREFVLGLGVMIKGTLDERIEHAFKGYDLDSDGVVSRNELHRMFKAYFYLSMQLVRDYVKTVEQDMMDTFDDEAAKPVSASFTAPIPSTGNNGEGADEDQTHLKMRYDANPSTGHTNNHRPSSRLNSATSSILSDNGNRPRGRDTPSRTASPAPYDGYSSASTSMPTSTRTASARNRGASPTTATAEPSTARPRPDSSSSFSAPPLTIDVGDGKTRLGRLPSLALDPEANARPFSAYPTPTSTTSRRSPSPTSPQQRAPSSPTYAASPLTHGPTVARLSISSDVAAASSGTLVTSPTMTTTAMGTSGGLLSRGTRAIQEVQALRRRSNVSLRSVYREGSIASATAATPTGFSAGLLDLQSPVSPFEELLLSGTVGMAVGATGSGALFAAMAGEDNGRLPVIEAMSQDAIEEMVERTFVAAGAQNRDFVTLEEFRKAVEHDHSYLQWFEALGSVF